jgi:hypothetical protein
LLQAKNWGISLVIAGLSNSNPKIAIFLRLPAKMALNRTYPLGHDIIFGENGTFEEVYTNAGPETASLGCLGLQNVNRKPLCKEITVATNWCCPYDE